MNSTTMGGLEQCTNTKNRTKTLTRSSARHLRRKRMKDARKHKSEDSKLLEGNCSIRCDKADNIPPEGAVVTKLEAEGQESKEEECRERENSQNSNGPNSIKEEKDQGWKTLLDVILSQKSPENAALKFEEYIHNTTLHSTLDQIPSLGSTERLNILSMTYMADLQLEAGRNFSEQLERAARLNFANCASRVAESDTNMDEDKPKKSEDEHEKRKEDIKAERKARKAEKAAAKANAKAAKTEQSTSRANKSEETVRTTDTVKETESTRKMEKAETPVSRKIEVAETPVTRKIEVAEAPATNTIQETLDAAKSTLPPDQEPSVSEGKSKAQLRAERRAKQEAQRAAKQKKQQEATQENQSKPVKNREVTSNKSSTGDRTSSKPKQISNPLNTAGTSIPSPPEQLSTLKKKDTSKKLIVAANNKDAHEANLFKHLYHERELAFIVAPSVKNKIHPGIVRLGVQYANKIIVGSNARCVALLAAVKQLVRDFERPSQTDFIRSLESTLQESVAYLHHCRPTAVSMQNALKHLKWQMTQLPSTMSDADAKTKLESAIDTYILEQIQLAGKAISITIQSKISNGDVILTYGYSSLINKILLDAHAAGKKFRVIVVDGRPWLEGKEQLRRLAKNGVECSYILINALDFVMPEVSKVFLGAHAILANGAVMSRVGTAQVALMAKAFNVPVLVACETHKSCERVQTDSIVYNELGNPDDLASFSSQGSPTKKAVLANWKSKRSLNLLNITYDVTPADFVTAVVTELAILPCTSVPVILRIKPSKI